MAASITLRGRVVTPDEVIADGLVSVSGDRLEYAGPAEAAPEQLREGAEQVSGYIMPGLVDIHCHGGGSQSFPDALNAEDAKVAVLAHRRAGTTSLVASTVTAAPQTLRERTATLRELCEAGDLVGIHWEGPFISCERCGAQDPALIIPPDPELTRELCEIAGPYAFTMTIAPEKALVAGDGGVADVLINAGALPSFGHTDAGPVETEQALRDAAARLKNSPAARSARATATHLFNGMRPIHHRDPGPITAMLSAAERRELVVELIADGAHLSPELVRHVYELLGREACVFVTDAMAAAGMPDGQYRLGSQDVTVADGVARLTGGNSIAGGTSRLIEQVRLMAGAGIPLVDCVYMAATGPAVVLGRDDIGELAAGARADLLIVDDELAPVRVYHGGELVS